VLQKNAVTIPQVAFQLSCHHCKLSKPDLQSSRVLPFVNGTAIEPRTMIIIWLQLNNQCEVVIVVDPNAL
jgi:hypothetical protein